MMKKFLYIFLLFLIIINLQYRIEEIRQTREKAEEILYLPKGSILKHISLGNHSSFASLLWLQFIQYYGAHLQTDKKYPYLFPILDILTDLDQKFLYAYTFGSVLLAHDCKDEEKSTRLIKKGMFNNPIKWEYPFWAGFLNYVFFKKYEKAGIYFKLSSLKPSAPDITYRWTAFVYYHKLKDLETALLLWYEMKKKAKSEYEKKIAETYIARTIMKINIRDLQIAVNIYHEENKKYPQNLNELVQKGYIKKIPEDPFGGYYYLRDGKVHSTSQSRIDNF